MQGFFFFFKYPFINCSKGVEKKDAKRRKIHTAVQKKYIGYRSYMCYTLSMFSRLLLSKFKAGAAFHSYNIGYRAQTSNAHL